MISYIFSHDYMLIIFLVIKGKKLVKRPQKRGEKLSIRGKKLVKRPQKRGKSYP